MVFPVVTLLRCCITEFCGILIVAQWLKKYDYYTSETERPLKYTFINLGDNCATTWLLINNKVYFPKYITILIKASVSESLRALRKLRFKTK